MKPHLLPGRVIDASTSIVLRNPRSTRRLAGRTDDEGGVWTARQISDDDVPGTYARDDRQYLSAGDAVSLRTSALSPSEDAAAMYEYYARVLLAPRYPLLSVYA